jgi:phosphoglycolate phosphatase
VRLQDSARFLGDVERALVAIELAACEAARPADGAVETLAWLRESGVRVGIVTRNSRQAVERLLGHFPLPHEVLLTRADTPRVKPDPVHLALALDHLETEAARSVMVGDHVMDVQAGKAAGMRTLGILLPDRGPDYFQAAAPDGLLHALPELRAWISP